MVSPRRLLEHFDSVSDTDKGVTGMFSARSMFGGAFLRPLPPPQHLQLVRSRVMNPVA